MERGADIGGHGDPKYSPITRKSDRQSGSRAFGDSAHGLVGTRIPQRHYSTGTLHWGYPCDGDQKIGCRKPEFQ